MSGGRGQTLFSGAQRQDKGQWAQTEAQEVPSEHEEELLHFEGDGALEQAAQGGCGVFFLEIFKTLLDAVLCSLLWVTLLQQGIGLGDPQRALPAPAVLGFCFRCSQGPTEFFFSCIFVAFGGAFFLVTEKAALSLSSLKKLMATSSRAHLQSFSSETAESCHGWSSVEWGLSLPSCEQHSIKGLLAKLRQIARSSASLKNSRPFLCAEKPQP